MYKAAIKQIQDVFYAPHGIRITTSWRNIVVDNLITAVKKLDS